MDRQTHEQIIADAIAQAVATLLPDGAGIVSAPRLRQALDRIGALAFREGQSYALLSLLTVEDVADQLGISARRVRALAAERHERFGIGYRVPGTGAWLFRPEELDALRPGPAGYPKGQRRLTRDEREDMIAWALPRAVLVDRHIANRDAVIAELMAEFGVPEHTARNVAGYVVLRLRKPA